MSPTIRALFVTAACVCSMSWPFRAWAEEGDKTSTPRQALAEALIDEGVQLRIDGRESEALEKFEAAHEAFPSARALAQVALVEKSLRRWIDAERHLERALAQTDDPWIAKNRPALEEVQTFIAKQLGWLIVGVHIDGARVSIDGRVVGLAPLSRRQRVVAGTAVVDASHDGYEAARRTISVAAGEVTTVELKLQPTTASPDAAPAPQDQEAKPTRVELDAGHAKDAPEFAASRWPWVIGIGAVGVASAAVGTGLGVRTLQLKRDRDALCGLDGCIRQEGVDLDREARAMALGSTVAFGVAGVAAVTSVVLALVLDDEAPATAWGREGLQIRF